MKKAGVAGGAMVSGGAVLSALAPSAIGGGQSGRPPAKFGKGDVGILNYALTLEYLEAAVVQRRDCRGNLALSAAGDGVPEGRLPRTRTNTSRSSRRHWERRPSAEPYFDFKGANTNAETFMATAEVGEDGRARLLRTGAEHQDAGLRQGRGLDPDRSRPVTQA